MNASELVGVRPNRPNRIACLSLRRRLASATDISLDELAETRVAAHLSNRSPSLVVHGDASDPRADVPRPHRAAPWECAERAAIVFMGGVAPKPA